MRRSLDVLLLFLLITARLRINSFAEAGLFEHFANVVRHPWVGGWLPPKAVDAFGPWFGDPVFLLLAAVSLLAMLLYALVDLWSEGRNEERAYRLKMALLWVILAALLFLPTLKLALLRHDNLPHSYSHDGGVIQTEIAITYFLDGRNPYRESYAETPMAEWGFPAFRTALEHYPYLPATFVLSAPVQVLSRTLFGWYDQRFTYLLLMLLTLVLLPGLAGGNRRDSLLLTMLIGLNPIMGLDVVFGQNDSFVLAWVVLGFWLLRRGRPGWSSVCLGLAGASKPTAWFLVPFWGLALLDDRPFAWRDLPGRLPLLLRRSWPGLLVFLGFVLPYLVWDPDAFVDDVWRWATGTAATHYQIWGWGFANFVLATGVLPDRFAYWPFWIPELVVGLPLLLYLLHRQRRTNTPGRAVWHGALLLFAFAYFSRFLNENYLGFLLALLTLGYFGEAVSSFLVRPSATKK